MIWWIVLAVVVFALIVLAVVGLGTVRRLAGLQMAADRLRNTQSGAAALLSGTEALQRTVEALTLRAERTQSHLRAIKDARRAESTP